MEKRWIGRALESKLVELAGFFPVVAVTGLRQSGTTSLVRRCFPQLPYVTLESIVTRARLQNDPRGFLKEYEKGAIFDEAQRVPELFSYLQEMVDADRQPGRFVLSGSQHFLLLERITQSLAGRVALLELMPLSFDELGQRTEQGVNETLVRGFFPDLYTQPLDPLDWYPNYLSAYVERDVRSISNVTDLSRFQTFLMLCAGRCGQLFHANALAGEVGVSANTIKSWLSILKASYVVFTLPPYYKNFNKRLVKSEKLYFSDTGLACALLGIAHAGHVQNHPLRGHLFENMVVADFVKQQLHRGRKMRLYFWRDSAGHEVDCVADFGGSLVACEIKSSATFHRSMLASLTQFSRLSGCQDNRLVFAGDEGFSFQDCHVMPWHQASLGD